MAAKRSSKGRSSGSKPARSVRSGTSKKSSTKKSGGRIGGEIVKKDKKN